MSISYDIIILGSGPAGFSCAMQSAKFNKSVLIVEADPENLGGTWINTGTVPSKALRETARNIYTYTSQFGQYENKKPYERFKMRDLLKYKERVLENENSSIKKDLIKNNVHTARGYGKIVEPNLVEITDHLGNSRKVQGKFILVSTGSRPTAPSNFTVDHKVVFDANSILNLDHIPRRLVIVGGNIQALEFATIFAALGTNVTVLNEQGEYLPFIDAEIKEEFDRIIYDMRISIHNNVEIQGVNSNKLRNCTEVRYNASENNGELKVLETEVVLHFGSRKPNTEKLGLESVGVETDEDGYIIVNEYYKTSNESIYACGDVVGFPSLASASFTQGRLASCDMFEIPSRDSSPNIPFGIYTIPEIAAIGLTEEEAIEAGHNVTIGRTKYDRLTKADIAKSRDGLLKLVFDTDTFRLLGIHIVGDNATELIHLGQSVLFYGGDIRYFISNVINYPTYTEAYRIAAFNGVNKVYKSGVGYDQILE